MEETYINSYFVPGKIYILNRSINFIYITHSYMRFTIKAGTLLLFLEYGNHGDRKTIHFFGDDHKLMRYVDSTNIEWFSEYDPK